MQSCTICTTRVCTRAYLHNSLLGWANLKIQVCFSYLVAAVTVDGSGRSNSNLTVDVKGAVNLFPVPCSPVYCEVRVGGVAYCTPSVKGMASPRWNCPVSIRKYTCTCA